MLFCTDCGMAWHVIIVGSYYVGEIGHGRVMPMIQNRCLKVDPAGNLCTIPPAKEESEELEIPKMKNIDILAIAEHNRIVDNARKEEREAITAYIDARANWLSGRLDEPDFDPDETDIVVECIEELHSIASRIKLNKHLE